MPEGEPEFDDTFPDDENKKKATQKASLFSLRKPLNAFKRCQQMNWVIP